jgi:hypothetical protein
VGRRWARHRADATRARARLVSTASDVGCQRARPRAGASQGPPARRPLGRPAARRPRARRGQPPVGREPGPSVEAAGATAFTCQSGWQRMTIRQSNRPSVTRPDHPSPGRTIRHPAGPSVTRSDHPSPGRTIRHPAGPSVTRPDHPSLDRTIRHPAGPSVTRPDHPSPGRTIRHPAGPSITRPVHPSPGWRWRSGGSRRRSHRPAPQWEGGGKVVIIINSAIPRSSFRA